MDPDQQPLPVMPRFWFDNIPPFHLRKVPGFENPPTDRSRQRVELFYDVNGLFYRRWNRGPSKFSLDELVMFALLYSDWATITTIGEWILKYFARWRRERPTPRFRPDHRKGSSSEIFRDDMHTDIRESLQSLDMPVHRPMPRSPWDHGVYQIDLPAARILIEPTIHPQGQESRPFRFLDLPSHLRVKIYKMTFKFPQSGLIIKRETFVVRKREPPFMRHVKIAMVYVASPEWEAFTDWSDISTADYWDYLHGKPLGAYLEILRTCRQVHDEAMPVFYSTNKFVILDFQAAPPFLLLDQAPPFSSRPAPDDQLHQLQEQCTH